MGVMAIMILVKGHGKIDACGQIDVGSLIRGGTCEEIDEQKGKQTGEQMDAEILVDR